MSIIQTKNMKTKTMSTPQRPNSVLIVDSLLILNDTNSFLTLKKKLKFLSFSRGKIHI